MLKLTEASTFKDEVIDPLVLGNEAWKKQLSSCNKSRFNEEGEGHATLMAGKNSSRRKFMKAVKGS